MTKRMRMLCPECRADAVQRDAIACWSEPEQRWEIQCVLDNMDCGECGAEIKIAEEEPIENEGEPK